MALGIAMRLGERDWRIMQEITSRGSGMLIFIPLLLILAAVADRFSLLQ